MSALLFAVTDIDLETPAPPKIKPPTVACIVCAAAVPLIDEVNGCPTCDFPYDALGNAITDGFEVGF